jgi:hypothetical protein
LLEVRSDSFQLSLQLLELSLGLSQLILQRGLNQLNPFLNNLVKIGLENLDQVVDILFGPLGVEFCNGFVDFLCWDEEFFALEEQVDAEDEFVDQVGDLS